MDICSCPACKHERSGSPAPYIPVGIELLEELDAHPERAVPLVFDPVEQIGWTTTDDAAETGTPWD